MNHQEIISQFNLFFNKNSEAICLYLGGQKKDSFTFVEQENVIKNISQILVLTSRIYSVRMFCKYMPNHKLREVLSRFIRRLTLKKISLIEQFTILYKEHCEGLEFYFEEVLNRNLNSIEIVYNIINNRLKIIEIDSTLKQFASYSHCLNAILIFLNRNCCVDSKITFKEKCLVVNHINEVISINRTLKKSFVWYSDVFQNQPEEIKEEFLKRIKIPFSKDSVRFKYYCFLHKYILNQIKNSNLTNSSIETKFDGSSASERNKEINQYIQKLKKLVSGWYDHTRDGELKHKWYYDYYPYDKHKKFATYSIRETWSFIWHFKNDPHARVPVTPSEHQEALDMAVRMVENTLKETFGDNVSNLTLVCLTASTREKNECRFKPFAERVCNDLNMYNAYSHINITSEGEAKHEGGFGVEGKYYDTKWFKDKYIVLFDDVRTSGASISNEKRNLESLGAHVICALTLAQTTN